MEEYLAAGYMSLGPETSGVAFCPQCGAEYRKPAARCSRCDVLLVDRNPAESPNAEEPADAGVLDVLIQTSLYNPIAITLAESLLRKAEIPFFVMHQDVTARQESGNALGWWSVLVARDRESEAREILQSVESAK